MLFPSPPSTGERGTISNRLAIFALVLGVLAGWLALGKYGYLYYLQTFLPLVGQFRLSARYFTLVSFAAAVLGAVAFARLLDQTKSEEKAPWSDLFLPWASVAVTLAVAIAFYLAFPRENGRSIYRNYLSGPLFLFAAVCALSLAARGWRVGLFVLIALAAVDLGLFSVRSPFWGASLWRDLPTLAEFQAHAESPPRWREGRWLDDAFDTPHPVLFDQQVVEGYRGGLEPMKRLDYRSVAVLRVSHTAWYHTSGLTGTSPPPGLQPRGKRWYEVPEPLPYVRLVNRTQVSEKPSEDIQHIDVDTTALVTHAVEVDEGEAGSARLIEEQPGELQIEVDAPGRQLLVVAESFDPSWQVLVDDRTGTAEQVNGDFLGCIVPSGEHVVRFVFHPASIRYGRFLSLIGLSIALVIASVSCVQIFNQSRRAAGARGSARTCG